MNEQVISEFQCGDMAFLYLKEEATGAVGLLMVPFALKSRIVWEKKYAVEPLVQLKLIGDNYSTGFSHGKTMRNSESTKKLVYERQFVEENPETGSRTVVTVLTNNRGCKLEHRLVLHTAYSAVETFVIFKNESSETVKLEMLSSFAIGGITPFTAGDAHNTLQFHRLRSVWSSEGLLETVPVEVFQLEPSWLKGSVQVERFGQVGSMPVRGFFAFLAVEDTKNQVTWGARLAHPASWQMEIYRKDDGLSISGGLADREFGHWLKHVGPGESLTTPTAMLSVCEGGVDRLSQRLTSLQNRGLNVQPAVETDLPIIFNEFCTTWGVPNEENLDKITGILQGKGITYLVIDAGWYALEGMGWGKNQGDWNPSAHYFPGGIKKTLDLIRERGMIPGIWFEFEICAAESAAFQMTDHLLKRDGIPIQTGIRRFWNFRDPFVIEYLTGKIIRFLRENGIGYMKIDYNDNIGIGCEGAESLGEGLRLQMAAVQDFIRLIRKELPELVIENCSSGGHRLEPSMMAITSMASFSDAHECVEIPIVAANVHRAILPAQNQIWAVLRKADTTKRTAYSIANTFLGRMCLSGEIYELNETQWGIVEEGITFYKQIAPLIKHGTSYRFGEPVKSYRHPEGWQAVLRVAEDSSRAFIVIHTFDGALPGEISVPLPESTAWRIGGTFSERPVNASINNNILTCGVSDSFQAIAICLE